MGWMTMIAAIAVTLMVLASLFARARAALQTRANELKMLGEKVGAQARELVNAREAVAETAREARQRATEAEKLRNKVADLEHNLDGVTRERDDLRAEVAAGDARVADLSARLARECERAARLEREAAAADAVRLELLSKLQAEAGSRAAAVEQLREPAPLPSADVRGVALNSVTSSEMDFSPFVTWSSHDIDLLNVTPNLTGSEMEPESQSIVTNPVSIDNISTNSTDVADIKDENDDDVAEDDRFEAKEINCDGKDILTNGDQAVANDTDSVQTDDSYSIEIDVTGVMGNDGNVDERNAQTEKVMNKSPRIIRNFVSKENNGDVDNIEGTPLCLYRIPWEDSLHPSWTNVDGTPCIARAALSPALHSTSSAVVAFGPVGYIHRAISRAPDTA